MYTYILCVYTCSAILAYIPMYAYTDLLSAESYT